jgi:general secretion pathway protein G
MHMENTVRHERRGFTLIELLVVIAIIAILAAILFPVFVRAKEMSRKAKCLHNLKEIGTAILNYCGDNGDRFPWAVEDYQFTRGSANYMVLEDAVTYRLEYLMKPYTKSEAIFHCPSDVGMIHYNSTHLGAPFGTPLWKNKYSSYGYADVLVFKGKARLAGKPTGLVIQPTKATMMWEHEIWHYIKAAADFNTEQDTINVLYCDGHVKPMGQGYFNSIIWNDRCGQ